MKKLQSFEFKSFGDRAKSKHDWAALLSGEIIQMEEGTDFTCKTQTLMTLARSAAKKRGLKLRSTKVEGGVVLQAYKDGEPEPEPTPPEEKKKSRK